ncbi:putative 2-dehydropantoate 2-reductase [Leptolyngbya sp. PCC 6406]|uniref:putative 2-dehydropantoate 2-reductase n=1 Tax=Leptolyngbya sp. PCC 6406 TaxID=1173264 RepID=UPI0002AC99C9|nr:putative 2-dehydropantoate 2-reductase [Leptolyngbya sp. PCC 6406]
MSVIPAAAGSRRYAILGTGAIGGYYGACLQRSGAEVHYLLHRDYDHVQSLGLRIDSVKGSFVLPQVNAYRQVEAMPPVDVVLIGLKTTQNSLLRTLLPPLLGPETVVLTLQNGLAVESAIAPLTQGHPVLGGLCFICSNKVGPGHIHHLDYGNVLLGRYDPQDQPGGLSPLLTAIAADFQTAGIAAEVTPDLYMARWRKLVWNIPFNALSVVLDATTDAMVNDPNIAHLIEALMGEVLEAAAAWGEQATPGQGRALPRGLVAEMMDHTRAMKPYRTSMKIDYDEGRPLEVEAILGAPVSAAQSAGVAVPRIEMLYHQVKALDRRSCLRRR